MSMMVTSLTPSPKISSPRTPCKTTSRTSALMKTLCPWATPSHSACILIGTLRTIDATSTSTTACKTCLFVNWRKTPSSAGKNRIHATDMTSSSGSSTLRRRLLPMIAIQKPSSLRARLSKEAYATSMKSWRAFVYPCSSKWMKRLRLMDGVLQAGALRMAELAITCGLSQGQITALTTLTSKCESTILQSLSSSGQYSRYMASSIFSSCFPSLGQS